MSAPRGDVCHRCLQPLPPKVGRCPNCGERRQGTVGSIPVLIGTAGVLALAFLIWIMVVVIQNEDIMNGPSPDSPTTTSQPAKAPALDK